MLAHGTSTPVARRCQAGESKLRGRRVGKAQIGDEALHLRALGHERRVNVALHAARALARLELLLLVDAEEQDADAISCVCEGRTRVA